MPERRRIKEHISANTKNQLAPKNKQNSLAPSDFSEPDILDQLPEAIRALAMKWYERGIRRGLKKATDLMLEDQIFKEDGVLHAPNSIDISLKTRCGDEQWEHRQLTIQAEEIGFER